MCYQLRNGTEGLKMVFVSDVENHTVEVHGYVVSVGKNRTILKERTMPGV